MLKNLKPCKDTDFGGKVAFAFLLDFVVGTKDDEADEAAFVVIAGMDDTVPIAEQHPMMGRLVPPLLNSQSISPGTGKFQISHVPPVRCPWGLHW